MYCQPTPYSILNDPDDGEDVFETIFPNTDSYYNEKRTAMWMRFHDTGLGNPDKAYWERAMKAKAGEIEKLEDELKTAWDNGQRMKEEQQNMIKELNRLRAQLEEKAAPADGGKETKKKKAVKKPTAPKRKPLDMGKARALREAGWSLKQIGDEMGVSPQTIANALNRKEETEEEKDV